MEQRIEALENLARMQAEFNGNLMTMLQSQEEVNRNVLTMLQSHEEAMAEMREDHRKTQRLWVRLAQKYGWLEDIDPSEDMP